MRKFIYSILIFIPIFIISYLFLLIIWGEITPRFLQKNLAYRIGGNGHLFSRIQEVQKKKDIDVLFLGSSHAYRGFDTRIFDSLGLNTFNLGSSAQTPLQTQVLLTRYLPTLNPKTILYEVYPGTFSIDGVESSLDLLANDRIDNEAIAMTFEQNHLKTYNTLVYGIYRGIFHRNKGFSEPKTKDGDTYISGGFVEKEKQYFKHIQPSSKKWDLNPSQFESFKKNIDLIHAQKAKLILVQAPIAPILFKSYTNNAQFDSIMRSYGTYYNFNELVSLDDSLHFYDAHHLNQDGVTRFNQKLIEMLFSPQK